MVFLRLPVISNPVASELLLPEIRRLHVPYPYNVILGRDTALPSPPSPPSPLLFIIAAQTNQRGGVAKLVLGNSSNSPLAK